MEDNAPHVFRNFAGSWPAVSDPTRQWKNTEQLRSRLMEHEEDAVVPVEFNGTYMSKDMVKQNVGFVSILDTLLAEATELKKSVVKDERYANTKNFMQWYLAQYELGDSSNLMREDVETPSMLNSDDYTIYRNNLWLGGHAGTVSPCHFDPFHNLLVQITGEKSVLLFDHSQAEFLYPASGVQKNTSSIENCDEVDLTKFSKFADASGLATVLQPGDCLYIPKKDWHFCKTESASCSVNWWFV